MSRRRGIAPREDTLDRGVGDALKKRIRQSRFESPTQEAMLNLIVSANFVRELSERVVEKYELTMPQYNVLRILKGVHPEGHPRCEIASRMLDRAPDVTRILDRLVEKEVVERERDGSDRRHSIARITKKGIRLLEQMDPEMSETLAGIAQRLSDDECAELSRICEKIYGGEN